MQHFCWATSVDMMYLQEWSEFSFCVFYHMLHQIQQNKYRAHTNKWDKCYKIVYRYCLPFCTRTPGAKRLSQNEQSLFIFLSSLPLPIIPLPNLNTLYKKKRLSLIPELKSQPFGTMFSKCSCSLNYPKAFQETAQVCRFRYRLITIQEKAANTQIQA